MVEKNEFEIPEINNDIVLGNSYILQALCICRRENNDELRNVIARVFSSSRPAESDIEALKAGLADKLEKEEISVLVRIMNDDAAREKIWRTISKMSFFSEYNGILIQRKDTSDKASDTVK